MKYDYILNLEGDNPVALFLQRIRPESKVLEFGTSTGYMTKYLAEKLQCSVWGVELDAEAAARAEQYACRMIVADVDSLLWVAELGQERFDYVVFADVLEHLRKPQQALEAVKEFLAPEGVVMISTPNIAHNAVIMQLLQDEFTYRSTGLLDDTHIHFFTRRTLETMLQNVGLKSVEWLTTEVHPEQTEFAIEYSSFPQYVEDFLRRRKFGHTYQHIVICRFGMKATVPCVKIKLGDEAGPTDRFLQVYWPVNEGYIEECSVTQPLRECEGFHRYCYEIPFDLGNDIRIDIGSRTAFFEIQEIGLFYLSSMGEETCFYCSNYENDFEGLSFGADVVFFRNSKHYTALSIGADPQVLFKCGKVSRQEGEKVYLFVKLRWSWQITSQVAAQLAQLYQQQENARIDLIKGWHDEVKIRQELQTQNTALEGELAVLQDSEGKTKRQLKIVEECLQSIYCSRGWRILTFWYKVRDWFNSLRH